MSWVRKLPSSFSDWAVEVIAADRYANAPAMQVAHRSHVLDMLDASALRELIELENLIISCLKLKPLLPMFWLK